MSEVITKKLSTPNISKKFGVETSARLSHLLWLTRQQPHSLIARNSAEHFIWLSFETLLANIFDWVRQDEFWRVPDLSLHIGWKDVLMEVKSCKIGNSIVLKQHQLNEFLRKPNLYYALVFYRCNWSPKAIFKSDWSDELLNSIVLDSVYILPPNLLLDWYSYSTDIKSKPKTTRIKDWVKFSSDNFKKLSKRHLELFLEYIWEKPKIYGKVKVIWLRGLSKYRSRLESL